MPRENKDKICQSYEEVKCLIEASKYWSTQKTSKTNSLKPCDCLDTCRNAEYFVRFKKMTELIDSETKKPHKFLKK